MANRTEYNRQYREANLEKRKSQYKIWSINNKQKKAKLNKEWSAKNRNRRNAYQKEKLANDPNFKIAYYLRNRIRNVLNGANKSASTIELLGCSIDEFKLHLQKKFQDYMTFDNYGKWHIDHIIPCAKFNLADEQDQYKCFHYTNLQPLWAEDNLKKGAKLNYGS